MKPVMCASCGRVEAIERTRDWHWGPKTRGIICEQCLLQEEEDVDAVPTGTTDWRDFIITDGT